MSLSLIAQNYDDENETGANGSNDEMIAEENQNEANGGDIITY